MSLFSQLLVLVLLLGMLGYWLGRRRALGFVEAQPAGFPGGVHSLPVYHGLFVAASALLPALLLLALWGLFADAMVARQVIAGLPQALRPAPGPDEAAFLSDVRGLVRGDYAAAFHPVAEGAAQAWVTIEQRLRAIFGLAALLLAAVGGTWGWRRLRPDFRARSRVERLAMWLLMLASWVAILTTLGIILSLIVETVRFFRLVPVGDFLLGTSWSPQTALRADQVGSSGAFGALPLFWGTVFVGAILAMIIAVPLGLLVAIYLSHYAGSGFRRWARPLLELLAGVPTVVYGFFAALVVGPALRDLAVALGHADASAESALAAGLVMGAMILPFVALMADDALSMVPASVRDGSLALGATPSETILRVLVPAALPGIMGGVLLAVSRAIGETMIVVMAAGLAARLTLNPLQPVTTMTAGIVALITGDPLFDSAKTLSAFALGLVLFAATFALNVSAVSVMKRHRLAHG